jgi:hypothetical protein
MFILFAFLSLGAFANTFEWKGINSFTLKIDSRNLVYISKKSKVEGEIKTCNLPLVRALNAELVGLIPQSEVAGGVTYMVDANSFLISGNGKEAALLNEMDKKIDFYREEEIKACKKKGP